MFDLNANISAWMSHVQAKLKLTPSQNEELQNQLNASIQSLTQTGLTPEEAFLIAVKRVITEQGYTTIVDSESEVWKQVQIKAPETKADTNRFRSILLVIVFSAIAGTLSKIPEWFFRPGRWLVFGL